VGCLCAGSAVAIGRGGCLGDDPAAQLRAAAEEDHRSLHATVLLALETYLALRETAEIKADPEALRSLAEAREAVRQGDVVYGTDAVRRLLGGHRAS